MQEQHNPQSGPLYPPPGGWTTGLCDCCHEPGICCFTILCPCFTFGWTAEIIDRGRPSCLVSGLIFYVIAQIGCACLYSHIYRNKIRGIYSSPEKPCKDCCVHWWCGYCALCQEYRELKYRGWKPSLGWEGQEEIMKRPNPLYLMPPQVPPGMAR